VSNLRGLEHSLPMQLLRARETAMEKFRPMLREHGLTEQQWRVLRGLAAEERLDAGELADRCFLLGPSLSRILQALVSDHLIKRSADSNDQRRSIICLTAAGRSKCKKVGPDAEALYQSIEKKFGKQKLSQLYKLLAELTQTITEP